MSSSLARTVTWNADLEDEISRSRELEHEWGIHDCLQFCARCVLAMTGEDLSEEFEDYDSRPGAAKILVERGGVSGLLTEALGDPVAPNLARRGDVVVTTESGEQAAGVCLGVTCAFVNEDTGLTFRSRECIEMAWRVG